MQQHVALIKHVSQKSRNEEIDFVGRIGNAKEKERGVEGSEEGKKTQSLESR